MTQEETSPRSWGPVALVVGLVAAFVYLPRLLHRTPSDAPDFSLEVVANGAELPGGPSRVHMADLQGHTVLIDFWATWCGYCRTEAPIVDRVARRLHDEGLTVLGVDEDRLDEGDPGAYAVAHGLSYPIARDPDGATMRKYEADGLPTLVVVSRTGKVTAVRSGVVEDGELERLVRDAL